MESRIVDAGRPTTRSLGMPVGGAADRRSWRLGNALVGNPPETPALEITLKGPTLQAQGPISAVVFGSPFLLKTDRGELQVGTTFPLEAGERLHIGGTPAGMRAYLCLAGGILAPEILHSRSGLQPVRKGDVLTGDFRQVPVRSLGPGCPFLEFPRSWTLAVLPGLQEDWFEPDGLKEKIFTVSSASNRMGCRLQGPALEVTPREMVSEPVGPGAVQVTRDGQCIVLGVDGQTIGGYPKIAQVIQADLDRLGQLRPGDTVRFEKVDLATARQRFLEQEQELREWLLRLQVAGGIND